MIGVIIITLRACNFLVVFFQSAPRRLKAYGAHHSHQTKARESPPIILKKSKPQFYNI